MDRNVSIIKDVNDNNIVIINDIKFKGKRLVNWDDVKAYLAEHVGEMYTIAESGDVIYIGKDLPFLFMEIMEKWTDTMFFVCI